MRVSPEVRGYFGQTSLFRMEASRALHSCDLRGLTRQPKYPDAKLPVLVPFTVTAQMFVEREKVDR